MSRELISKEEYIKRAEMIVIDDWKYQGQKIKDFKFLASLLKESFKDNPLFYAPEIGAGQHWIRDYIDKDKGIYRNKQQRKAGVRRSVNNSYEDLLKICKRKYALRILKDGLIKELIVSPNDKKLKTPIATAFVESKSEQLICDYLVDFLDPMIKGAIPGKRCVTVYFNSPESFNEFTKYIEVTENIEEANDTQTDKA